MYIKRYYGTVAVLWWLALIAACGTARAYETPIEEVARLRRELNDLHIHGITVSHDLDFAAGIEAARKSVDTSKRIVEHVEKIAEFSDDETDFAVESCREEFRGLTSCYEALGRFDEAAEAWRELHAWYRRYSSERHAVLANCLSHAECDEAAAALTGEALRSAQRCRRLYMVVLHSLPKGLPANGLAIIAERSLEIARGLNLPNRLWEMECQLAVVVTAYNTAQFANAWRNLDELSHTAEQAGNAGVESVHYCELARSVLHYLFNGNTIASQNSADAALRVALKECGPNSVEVHDAVIVALEAARVRDDRDALLKYGDLDFNWRRKRAITSYQILVARVQHAFVQFLAGRDEDARSLHAKNVSEMTPTTGSRMAIDRQLDFVELEAAFGNYPRAAQSVRDDIVPGLSGTRPIFAVSRFFRIIEMQVRHDDWEGVAQLLKQASEAVEESYGDKHRMGLKCRLFGVALALHEKRLDEAEESLAALEADAREILLDDDPLHAYLAENKAQHRWARGDREAAIALFDDGLEKLRTTLGEDSREYETLLKKANARRQELAKSGSPKPAKKR